MTRPYRPCNGSEGEWFESRFCFQCERDRPYREDRGDSCPILGNALCFSVDEPHYPKEWVEDDDGSNPRCTAFEPGPNAFWLVPSPASGMEAATAGETPKSGSTVGDSPVPEGQTPNLSKDLSHDQ